MISNSFTSYLILVNSLSSLTEARRKINVVDIKKLFFFRYDCSTTCSSLGCLKSFKTHLFIIYIEFGVLCLVPWQLKNADLFKSKGALSNAYLIVFLLFCRLFLLSEFRIMILKFGVLWPPWQLWMLIFASVRRPCPMLISLFPCSSFSLSESWSSKREMSTAPLSFKVSPIDGISIPPVCSCWFSMFVSVNPRISPCNAFSGNSKARQQVNDHFGFLRHSFT